MKNILSLAGGGYKGLYQAYILSYIEAVTNKKINELFDLIIGTSIGSVNAFALSIGISTQKIIDLYLSQGLDVFEKNALTNNIFNSKYPEKNISNFIQNLFTEKTMIECRIPTMSVSYNLTKREPILFKSYKSPEIKILDAVKSSSSAPTYFPSHEFYSDLLIDGGVMFNNPSLIGYIEAKKIFNSSINTLCIGTISNLKEIKIKDGGIIEWAPHLFDVLFEATNSGIDYFMKKLSTNGDSYLKIDIFENNIIEMDDITKEVRIKIRDLACATIKINKKEIHDFIEKIYNSKGEKYDLEKNNRISEICNI